MLPVDKHENSVVYVRRNEIYKEHALDEDETTELKSDGHNSSQFQEKDMCLESEYSWQNVKLTCIFMLLL